MGNFDKPAVLEEHLKCRKCGHCTVEWCPCLDWTNAEPASDKLCFSCRDVECSDCAGSGEPGEPCPHYVDRGLG